MICLISKGSSTAEAVLFSLLLVLASVCDIRKHIIPDSISLGIFTLGIMSFSTEKALGILLCLPFYFMALTANRNGLSAIGGGDIKLTAACGFFLGIYTGTTGLVIGLLLACVHGYCKIKIPSKQKNKIAIPIAPALSVGFLVSYFLEIGGLIT